MRISKTILTSLFGLSLVVPLHAADKKTQSGATLMGCLEKAEMGDSYMLTKGTGKGTVVTGPTQLENHIGHTVKLTGEEVNTAGHPVFQVNDIEHIAKTCEHTGKEAERVARAQFHNPDGKAIGQATLLQSNEGILIKATFSDLPNGTHALHIHETGSCEAPDFKSAGGHYNPTNAKHGLTNPDGPHVGDMPNFTAKGGETSVQVYNDRVTLEEGADNSLLKSGGTALVVHSGADDYQTDPAGDAGKRIACGVIEATQPGAVQAQKR